MRLSKRGIENIRRGLIRSWRDGTHRQLVQAQGIDVDTLRKRTLFDRKGQLIGTFTLYHSTGRSDQFDLYQNNQLAVTGGSRVVADWLARYKQL
jgi:hypothetical protein